MTLIHIAKSDPDGWYRVDVRIGNDIDMARDFVIHQLLPRAMAPSRLTAQKTWTGRHV